MSTNNNITNDDIIVLSTNFSNMNIKVSRIEKTIAKQQNKQIIVIDESEEINNNDTSIDNTQILEPCLLPEFIDFNILKSYVKKDIDGNKEYFDNLNITYKISDPKKAEWILN